MMKQTINGLLVMGVMAAGASANAILSFSPSILTPGEPTVVTVSLTDGTGGGFGIGYAGMTFTPGANLSASGYSWQGSLGTFPPYFPDSTLPTVSATLIQPNPPISVPANGTIVIGQLTLTIDESVQPGEDVTLSTALQVKRTPDLAFVKNGPQQAVFTAQVIPEPATFALFGLGAVCMLRRRRSSRFAG